MPLSMKEEVALPSSDTLVASPSSEQTLVSLERTGIAVPPPPDGGYGWVCVFAQFFINGFTWGVVAVCHL